MKLSSIIASLLLTAFSASAFAAADRSYYVAELTPAQRFDVYNDGRNTFLQSIPGLIVTGATADGEFFIVKGVPASIRGFMNGKPIVVVRGFPPAPKPATPDPAVVNAQIKQLTEKLDTLTAKVQPTNATAVAIGGAASSPQPTAVGAPGTLAGAEAFRQLAATQAPGAPKRIFAVPTPKAAPPSATDVFSYRVSPTDENLRVLVERWSKAIGWTAVWDVERDIPIGSGSEKAGDFKTVVRWVLSSTELGDLVVKPCFYSNSVVRVVRKTVKCNPNE